MAYNTFCLTPTARRRCAQAASAVCALAGFVALFGGVAGRDEWYKVGCVLLMLAATALVSVRASLSPRLLERARQQGWDEGYADGRRVAKPVVVNLARLADPAPDLGDEFGSGGCREDQTQSL